MKIEITYGHVTLSGDAEHLQELQAVHAALGKLCEVLSAAGWPPAVAPNGGFPTEAALQPKPRRGRRRKPEPETAGGWSGASEQEEAATVTVDTGRRKERETLDAVRSLGHASPSDVARKLGINPPAASARLKSLMAKGFLRLVKIGVYELMPPEDE